MKSSRRIGLTRSCISRRSRAGKRRQPRELKEKGARIVGINVAIAREHAGQLCRARQRFDRLRVRNRRIAKNRQMHDYAIIFSWHIADELAPKLKAEGFRGQLIAPSPIPRVL